MAGPKKSKGYAIASLVFGLLIWIPILNFFIGILAIVFGAKALKGMVKDPSKYNGFWIAIAGISLGSAAVYSTLIGLATCFAGFKEACTLLGLQFLAG